MAKLKRCIVPTCNNNTNNCDLIFVRFPGNYQRQQKWWKAIKKHFPLYNRDVFVCEIHFNLPEDCQNWERYKSTRKCLRMKEDVVPHKFIDAPPEKHIEGVFSTPRYFDCCQDLD